MARTRTETRPGQIRNWQREIAVEQLLGESINVDLVRYWLQLYARAEAPFLSGKRRNELIALDGGAAESDAPSTPNQDGERRKGTRQRPSRSAASA
ncbi:MAG: hypothetical protein ACREN8_02055 [Candidatus Dormibacteraceae bacterium]